MAAPVNPVATEHLPSFITAPGETDILMVVTPVILAVAILMFGILFFRLHSYPERMAHGAKKIQLEIVAVLGLVGLLTHIHAFWVAALLLAMIDIPDFRGMLDRLTGAVETMSGTVERMAGAVATMAGPKPGDAAAQTPQPERVADIKPAKATTIAPREVKSRAPKQKETAHT